MSTRGNLVVEFARRLHRAWPKLSTSEIVEQVVAYCMIGFDDKLSPYFPTEFSLKYQRLSLACIDRKGWKRNELLKEQENEVHSYVSTQMKADINEQWLLACKVCRLLSQSVFA